MGSRIHRSRFRAVSNVGLRGKSSCERIKSLYLLNNTMDIKLITLFCFFTYIQIESAMSMTPFSDEYMGSFINGVYQGDVSQGQGGVFVNATLKLIYEPRTIRPSLAGELQRHLLGVIHRRSNNIGNSALYVDSPPGSISNLQGRYKKI